MDKKNKHSQLSASKEIESHRVCHFESSDDSDSCTRISDTDFDALKFDTPSMKNANDPLSLPVVEDKENCAQNDSDEYIQHNSNQTEKSNAFGPPNFKIKIVPLEKLLQKKDTQISNVVDLSSSSSSDECLVVESKRKTMQPAKMPKSARQTTRKNYVDSQSSDETDSDVPIAKLPKRKINSISNKKSQQNVYAVKVRLTRMSSNMETLLKKYNLSEISDQYNNIIISRKKKQQNEVQNLP